MSPKQQNIVNMVIISKTILIDVPYIANCGHSGQKWLCFTHHTCPVIVSLSCHLVRPISRIAQKLRIYSFIHFGSVLRCANVSAADDLGGRSFPTFVNCFAWWYYLLNDTGRRTGWVRPRRIDSQAWHPRDSARSRSARFVLAPRRNTAWDGDWTRYRRGLTG